MKIGTKTKIGTKMKTKTKIKTRTKTRTKTKTKTKIRMKTKIGIQTKTASDAHLFFSLNFYVFRMFHMFFEQAFEENTFSQKKNFEGWESPLTSKFGDP